MKKFDWGNNPFDKFDKFSKGNLRAGKIALLGFGSENQALLKWLISHKCKNITICDKIPKFKLQIPNKFQNSNYKFQTGKNYLKNLERFDIIFRTPGIAYLTPEIQWAKKTGVEVSSQMKLFFDLCPAKIIGVTGTKGKGTTTALISEILKRSFQFPISNLQINSKLQIPKSKTDYKSKIINPKSIIYTGGNIGNAPIEFLDKLSKNDWVVLELSSFQLQDLDKSPHISVVLDIKEDHLDHHKTRKEYIEAKENIVKWQTKKDSTVINLDYLTSFRFAQLSPTQNDYYFSRRKSVDLGCFVEWEPKGRGAHFGKIILRTAKKDYEICKTYDITLRGQHNLENICAAVIASYLAGSSIKSIQEITPKFKGLEHRLEYVTQINSVKFYNDSFSTTPDTTVAAIKSFSEPIILIVGGSDKGANYFQLVKEIAKSSVKVIIAIGITGPKIVKNLKSKILNLKSTTKKLKIIQNCKDIPDIVQTAFKEAKPGDVVLLSPASASFDMFKNYKDRGERFKSAIADFSLLNTK